MSTAPPLPLTKADFQSDQETRWCPGCGDYSVLAAIQGFMPELGIPPERIVFVTGIGCAGRFAYYMDTYGMHAIHGRAPTIATGLAAARDDLSVWIVSGDGDALSIGANHLVHALRRNVPVKILLFNNRIYGLTKGQASPTSEFGKVTKSTPRGSIDPPLDALSLALGAGATFVARTVDRDKQGLVEVLRAAAEHRGTAFVEVLQDCPVFNDGAFDHLTDKDAAAVNRIPLVDGQPIRFGLDHELGVVRDDDGTLGSRASTRSAPSASSSTTPPARTRRSPSPSPAWACWAPGRCRSASSAPSTRRRGAATSWPSCAPRARGWATTTSTPCCTRATPGPSPAERYSGAAWRGVASISSVGSSSAGWGTPAMTSAARMTSTAAERTWLMISVSARSGSCSKASRAWAAALRARSRASAARCGSSWAAARVHTAWASSRTASIRRSGATRRARV